MGRLTKSDVEERFTQNIGRVRSLVATYTGLVGPGGGRAKVEHTDILRAAIILLHAALEDLLRAVEEICLPTATETSFSSLKFVPMTGTGSGGVVIPKDTKERFSLVELAPFRGQSVADVISRAIDFQLERSNYNNIADVKSALERSNIDYSFLSNADSASLEAMMRRRHLIAHRADRNPMSGKGHHLAQSIGTKLVEDWTTVVDTLGKAVLAKL